MLADKINNLIQDDELKQRFIKEAKCRLQFFYLSKIVEQTEKVYYETLNC
jgi:glycosyltransferase involved in cell wall biosynthesis